LNFAINLLLYSRKTKKKWFA